MNRSAWWAMEFSKLLTHSPELRAQIPEDATICVMPVEDPQVSAYNVSQVLLGREGVVAFVKLMRVEGSYHVVPHLATTTTVVDLSYRDKGDSTAWEKVDDDQAV